MPTSTPLNNQVGPTTEERQRLVYNLSIELQQVVTKKKEIVAGYNEDIKRIKKEIKDLLQDV